MVAGLVAMLAAAALLGCGAVRPATPPRAAAPFAFARDTFAFPNETLWIYRVDPATGETSWASREPAPDFVLRCGNMARASRQFRWHAQFAPQRPRLTEAEYAPLVDEVLARDSRATAPSGDPVVVPGYDGLRAFSAEHPALVQRALRGPWQSYLQRGNWRMIFPFSPAHQRDTAARLLAEVAAGELPIVHVLRYPQLTINHMLLVYAADAGPTTIRFATYDPNDAAAPLTLVWDRGTGEFRYPPVPYFGGGPVKVYEVYDGALY